MKVIKRIHRGYINYQEAKGLELPCIFGKYQYIYSSDKGEISLVQLKDYFKEGEDFWEIYCFKNRLFEDVERFNTKKEADKVIKKYLI